MSACLQPLPVARAHAGTDSRIILQRTGARPLCLHGKQLACTDLAVPPAWARIRLALYLDDDDSYVSELRCEPVCATGRAGGPAWCHAARWPTLEAALSHFETLQPVCDHSVYASFPADGAAALLHAAARLCRAAAREHALRHAVGMFLHDLCRHRMHC